MSTIIIKGVEIAKTERIKFVQSVDIAFGSNNLTPAMAEFLNKTIESIQNDLGITFVITEERKAKLEEDIKNGLVSFS